MHAPDVPKSVSNSALDETTGRIAASLESFSSKKARRPLSDSEIDFDVVEELWTYHFDQLRSDPTEHPVLAALPAWSSKRDLTTYAEIVMERFVPQAFFAVKDSSLASFAFGRPTSLVVDLGGGSTKISPVLDGYTLENACVSSFKASTTKAAEKIKFPKKKLPVHLRPDVYRSACKTWPTGPRFDPKYLGPELAATYALPDGTEIELASQVYVPAEQTYFNESDPQAHLPTLVRESLKLCHPDLRKSMAANIVLVGGGSNIPDVATRLFYELQVELPTATKPKISSSAAKGEKENAAFVGGSVLASLGSFQQMWITKSEYEEFGERVVTERCAY